jgi:SNF2 family DNA or RNA helicase
VSASAKLELLFELLDELRAEGRSVLVFSQFTSMLAVIGEGLTSRGIGYLEITGKTRKRQEIVDRFQAGEVHVMLVSLKAGGTGLNLTAADTVIHYDPWWNPAVERQASDRAHRIGQTRPVTVYRLVCEGTVEERMLALHERKLSLSEAIAQGAERRSLEGLTLDEADLATLFAPAG